MLNFPLKRNKRITNLQSLCSNINIGAESTFPPFDCSCWVLLKTKKRNCWLLQLRIVTLSDVPFQGLCLCEQLKNPSWNNSYRMVYLLWNRKKRYDLPMVVLCCGVVTGNKVNHSMSSFKSNQILSRPWLNIWWTNSRWLSAQVVQIRRLWKKPWCLQKNQLLLYFQMTPISYVCWFTMLQPILHYTISFWPTWHEKGGNQESIN